MRDPNPQAILLKDYTPPRVPDRHGRARRRRARGERDDPRDASRCARNPASRDTDAPLVLDGRHLELRLGRRSTDARSAEGEYTRRRGAPDASRRCPTAFTLETVVRFDPWKNTRLEGFYASKDGLFTQCEAQGFRCITYFIDRPDVMSRYSVTLHARQGALPAPARQRQPAWRGGRGGRRPPLGALGRSVPEALVPVRDGGGEARPPRGPLHHALRHARRCCRSTWSRASSTRPASRCTR